MSERLDSYARFQKEGGVTDLSDRLKLRLSGADRVRYLNGQVTANVQKLKPGEARAACVTTAKGRLCAEIFMHATDEALLLDADPALRETLPLRLERYIISDDATLTDVSGDFRLLHLIGPAMEQVHLFKNVSMTSRAHRFGQSGLDLWIENAAFEQTWTELTTALPIVDELLLESLRIEAGIPRWGRELDENTLPPEAGLERTHIDYDKGCYIGQEVISRLKSIGHVNRALTGFTAERGTELRASMGIFAQRDGVAAIGNLTSVAWSFTLEKWIALGYLKRGSPTGDLFARELGVSSPACIVHVQDFPLTS